MPSFVNDYGFGGPSKSKTSLILNKFSESMQAFKLLFISSFFMLVAWDRLVDSIGFIYIYMSQAQADILARFKNKMIPNSQLFFRTARFITIYSRFFLTN